MRSIQPIQAQRGVAVIIIVLIVAVVIAILVAVAVGTSAPTTPGTPPPACFPAATQCRVFIQNEVSCCGGVPVVGKRIGWCIGWWDATPCRGGPGQGQRDEGERVASILATRSASPARCAAPPLAAAMSGDRSVACPAPQQVGRF